MTPPEIVTIALDFDKTFTVDPLLWLTFVRGAQLRGHTVVMVTGRSDRVMHSDPTRHWGNEVRAALAEVGLSIPVVFAGELPKRVAARMANYMVDIWIDDDPEHVGG